MTEQEFTAIAAACDRLLRAPATSLARLAIPALHVLNEHPGSLAPYAPAPASWRSRAAADTPRVLLRATRGLARALTSAREPPLPNGPVDVIIVSHLSNAAQLDQEDDLYFGPLQSLLKDKGLTSLLVLIDHRPGTRRAFGSRALTHPRLVLPRAVNATTEIGIWHQCARSVRSLRREARGAANAIEGSIAMLASREAFSASTAVNLRTHARLMRLCAALDPRIVVTTYEGAAAERLIWHAARAGGRQPLCVGYQHARVSRLAHSIRRRIAVPALDCDPDVVLTLGELPHAALAASSELKSVRLISYGSHRRTSTVGLPPTQQRPRQCLVLPDADDNECVALFEFALSCARARPDVNFALRPHPAVDSSALVRRHPALQCMPRNAWLSLDTPLLQEFAQARYCLYRTSSAAVHAVLAGIKPFYLVRPGELPYDPLFELKDWRETVSSPQELTGRLMLSEPAPGCVAARDAITFCERYVGAVRPAAIDELLRMLPR